MMERTFHLIKYVDQEKLKMLSDEAVERFDELLEILGLELRRDQRMYYGSCPIHGGDRHNAFNLYHSGNVITGNWVCNTHQCQEIFKPTIIGFIRGVLSNQQCGWTGTGDTVFPFNKTVEFLLNFVKQDYDNLSVDLDGAEKRKIADHTIRFYNRIKKDSKNKITRERIIQSLKIPARYYLDRKYSRKILEKYDVGYCNDTSKPMYKRCVVPIYDDDHKFMVGCTGRSINSECETCKTYHTSTMPCPLDEDKWKYSKWRHSKGFRGEDWLYNMWFARQYIFQTKCAILVESPGNVWRLEEAGIHNSLGLFGTTLSEGQLDSLNKCGAHSVVLIPDKDDAGKSSVEKITKALDKLYNITVIDIESGDVGEIPVDIVRRDIVPEIEKTYI